MSDDNAASIQPDTDTGRVVLVRWVDSGTSITGWSSPQDLPTNVETVGSIGFWIGENEHVIAIAGTQTDDRSFLGCQIIWKRSIEEKTWA